MKLIFVTPIKYPTTYKMLHIIYPLARAPCFLQGQKQRVPWIRALFSPACIDHLVEQDHPLTNSPEQWNVRLESNEFAGWGTLALLELNGVTCRVLQPGHVSISFYEAWTQNAFLQFWKVDRKKRIFNRNYVCLAKNKILNSWPFPEKACHSLDSRASLLPRVAKDPGRWRDS